MLVLAAAVAPAPPDVEVAFTPFPSTPAVFVELEEIPEDMEIERTPFVHPRPRRSATTVAAGVTFAVVSGVLAGAAVSGRPAVPDDCWGGKQLVKCF